MIASIGPNLPQDIFIATGEYAGPVRFDPERTTPRADQWLESKFAPWAFAVLEAWADGEYDGLERVVFSRADDTAHRLYYYICELQRRGLIGGPEPIVFDVAKVGRRSSLARMTDEVRSLAALLGVRADALHSAIKASNVQRRNSRKSSHSPACLLAGTPLPDKRLHDAIVGTGYSPMGDTLTQSWEDLGQLVDEDAVDPCEALALQLHADPRGPRSTADPAKRLADRIRECDAQAVVLWRIEEDEAEAWHLPAQMRILEKSGLPHLVLTRRDWRCRDGAAEEVVSFLKEANCEAS